ncbi:hypothetical protein D3C76_904750 [compost metagenome]
MGQHFDFKKLRERLIVAHLCLVVCCDDRSIFLAADSQQLQPSNPAVGQFMHPLGVLGADIAQLRLEKLFGLDGCEAQISQVQFQHQFLAAQPRQRQRHGAT